MSEVKYSKEHEWIKVEGDVGTIGITQHATEMLGDIVFVELPELGSNVEKDGNAGVVESTKALSIFNYHFLLQIYRIPLYSLEYPTLPYL